MGPRLGRCSEQEPGPGVDTEAQTPGPGVDTAAQTPGVDTVQTPGHQHSRSTPGDGGSTQSAVGGVGERGKRE